MKYLAYQRMSNETKNKIVPKLRFPEFRVDIGWEEKTLSEVGEIITGKTPSTENEDFWGGDILFITPTDINEDNKYQSKTQRTITKQANTKVLPIGSIAYTCIASIGKIAITSKDSITNQQINSIVVFDNYDNEFVYYSLVNITPYIKSIPATSTLPIINKTEFSKLVINSPYQKEEQQKISSCLSSLDDLIVAENQKLKTIKAHKKGLMQQLFPAEGETMPKLRFAEFRDSGEWLEDILDNVATFLKGKGISKSDISPTGILPCIRYGELYTHYTEIINSVISLTNLPPDELILSEANDVIIPSSGETREDIATASCVMTAGIALGGDLNIIRSEINGVFLSYYLTHAKKSSIAKIAQGDAVVHLYSSQLKKLIINFPKTKDEQIKIANCLTSLDELVKAQAEKIEALKIHKKGLIQGLFPVTNKSN